MELKQEFKNSEASGSKLIISAPNIDPELFPSSKYPFNLFPYRPQLWIVALHNYTISGEFPTTRRIKHETYPRSRAVAVDVRFGSFSRRGWGGTAAKRHRIAEAVAC